MIGKELLELDYDDDTPGKTILSTYVPTNIDDSASETAATDEDSTKDGISEEEKEGVEAMKSTRPALGGMLDDDGDGTPSSGHAPSTSNGGSSKVNSKGSADSVDSGDSTSKGGDATKPTEPRRRFRDSLSALQIEEAKATGRAQLGLAFEMLTMMKKRALKADPEAYQCLIDACGRVGDTKRATDLLAKMHEDGIVADGTVYACLVSAFSAETAWKKGTKEEDLPGTLPIALMTF